MNKMTEKELIIRGIKARMREVIRERGCGVVNFCKENGIDKSTLYSTKSFPSSCIVIMIADQCHVTTDYILKGVK